MNLEFYIKKLGLIDKTTALNFFLKGWKAASSIITIFFVIKYLSPTEQGYYYTFFSLIGMQVLFELGFSQVIMLKASHMTKSFGAVFSNQSKLKHSNLSELSSLIKFSIKCYLFVSLALLFVLFISGFIFFKSSELNYEFWLYPWILLSISTSLNLIISPFFSFLEGCGSFDFSLKIRTKQSVVSVLLLWLCLIFNLKLYSIFIFNFVVFLVGAIFLIKNHGRVFKILIYNETKKLINWKKEILPLQLKIAISWICGYFQFQLFNPIIFKFAGPELAGKFGISMTIMSGIVAFSLAIVQPKTPLFANLASKNKKRHLNLLFSFLIKKVYIISFGFSLICVIFLSISNLLNLEFVNRFLDPWQFTLLSITNTLNIIITCYAYYLRSYYKEPLMLVSIFNALIIFILTLSLTPNFGINGLLLGYFSSTLFIGFVFSRKIFLNYYYDK